MLTPLSAMRIDTTSPNQVAVHSLKVPPQALPPNQYQYPGSLCLRLLPMIPIVSLRATFLLGATQAGLTDMSAEALSAIDRSLLLTRIQPFLTLPRLLSPV